MACGSRSAVFRIEELEKPECNLDVDLYGDGSEDNHERMGRTAAPLPIREATAVPSLPSPRCPAVSGCNPSQSAPRFVDGKF